MKKKQIIIFLVIAVLIVMTVVGILLFKNNKSNNEDAIKFKEEYEALNGTVREGTNNKYRDIKISKNNPIKYVDTKETLKVLKSEKAIIYVGAEWCPWCRNAVPVLFEVAKSYDVKTIYYLDLDDEKSLFEVKDGKVKETRHGTDSYYDLLEKLDSVLDNYTLTEDEKTYETGEKRIYMPFIITIKNGKIVDTHTGTVELDKGQTSYDELTSKQHDELVNIYSEMFEKLYTKINNTCNEESCS